MQDNNEQCDQNIIVGGRSFLPLHHEPEFVTFEQFGAKGNGKDETEAIAKAFAHAKSTKLPVKLLGKIYKFSPKSNVNITGIPLITGNGTIDVSDVGPNAGNKSMTRVFTVKGEKQLLQSNLHINKGKTDISLTPALNIAKGDVLFITSAEALPNQRRPYNCKGQRAIVSDYNKQTGKLIIRDSFYFNIDRAYIWKNTVQPFIEIGNGVKFITGKMNFVGCLEIVYAKALISGTYENFALAGISLRSSEGVFKNVSSNLPVTSNNGYSIGISVADLSEGLIKNCTLNGGRHNVSGTGGGLWRKSESGGADEAAGYPSVLEVNGGVYTGTKNVNGISEDNGTLDSHGNVYKMKVRNCTVYGGMNLGADYVEIDSVMLYTDTKRAFNFGSDVQPGSDWGHYKISNTTIIVDPGNKKSIFFTKSDVNEIILKNVKFSGIDKNTLLADFRYPGPKKLIMEAILWTHHEDILSPPRFLVNRSTLIEMDEISCIKREDIRIF